MPKVYIVVIACAILCIANGCDESPPACEVTNQCGPTDRCDPEARICVPAECEGTAESCENIPTADCEAAGCSVWEGCLGTPESCGSHLTEGQCNRIEGCGWSDVRSTCIGSAFGCGGFGTESECEVQTGCDWGSECEGTAASCRSLDEDHCEANPTCSVISE